MAEEPKTEELTADRVEVVDQIHGVKFGLRQSPGECMICGDDEDLVEVYAAIYYPGRDTLGRKCMIESIWSQHFCAFCINSFFGGAKKDVD